MKLQHPVELENNGYATLMLEKTVYLLRHGDTGFPGCYIGATDLPLSPAGGSQVSRTAKILQQENITRVFCSPMLRCRQTYERLDLPCPCDYHDSLREVDFGRWEGKRFAEIAERDAVQVERWTKDAGNFCFPEGESVVNFQQRIAAFMDILTAAAEDRILLVSHGGVIRHLLCYMLKLPLENYLVFDVRPGSFCSLQVYSAGSVLTGFNLKG